MGGDYRDGGLLDPTEADDDASTDIESREAWVDEAGMGVRLDRWLTQLAPEFSRNHLQSLIERGAVRVDGQPALVASRKLRIGQQVALSLIPTAESQAFRPEPMALPIVFEDEHLLVVNKPAGLVVHPAAGNWSGTLMNGLLAHHAGATRLPRAGIVHRLDKDTSGLMVVGKTLEAVTELVRRIAARDVHREYLALAHGALEGDAFSIDAPIRRDPASRIKMAIGPGGREARTDVEPLASRQIDGRWISAVRCRLHTGRTHQIRVHLAARGHPLLADAVYGGAPALGLTRQALHAARLSFAHPHSGARCDFEAALPNDLAEAWSRICDTRGD